MLASLSDGVVDFLVTEDSGLHTRARRHGLADRLLYVRQTIDQITDAYARTDYILRSIQRRYCYELDPNDPIFDSLERDYAPFRTWWRDICCQKHRECWTVSDSENIAGLCVFKDESRNEAPQCVSGKRILKLCTFKVSESYRGGRLGEQLLRQAMCFGFDAGFDSIYLTAFPKQQALRELLRRYGFRRVGENNDGELIYAKTWTRALALNAHRLTQVRRAYPAFPTTFSAGIIVPVRAAYHDRLFPEARSRLPNVPGELFTGAWSQGSADRSSPSNSISKAYLSHARLNTVEPGSLVCFYRTQDNEFGVPSSLIAIGVAESYVEAKGLSEAIEIVSKRSVYSNREIEELTLRGPLKILNFLFYGYLSTPLSLSDLMDIGALQGTPQSFVRIPPSAIPKIHKKIGATLVSA